MFKTRLYSLLALLLIIVCAGVACSQSPAASRDAAQRVADEFVKSEATYMFDGIPDTLKLTSSASSEDGFEFTFEFDSRHAGYGNRSGQILAEVITHHEAQLTVADGKVKSATMDMTWDMINQRHDVDIDLAPIHEVTVSLLKSNPPQIAVNIKGGLRDGCTTFNDLVINREGTTVNIEVTTRHPRGVFCPAIYTYFEKYVNLGSDFTLGVTYTLKVNDYTTTFIGQGPLPSGNQGYLEDSRAMTE